MTTAIRTIKSEAALLTEYREDLSGSANDGNIARNIFVTQDMVLRRNDASTLPVMPSEALKEATPSNQTVQLLEALLQPENALVTERIILDVNFRSLLQKRIPILAKAVSYPTAAREMVPGTVLTTDSFWMLDLYATGIAYARRMKNPKAFRVLNTAIYEGWNVFKPEERDYIASAPKAKQMIQLYFEVLNQPSYDYVLKNIEMRGRYVDAITELFQLPRAINAKDLIQSRSFLKYLDKLIKISAEKGWELFPQKPNGTFDFAAFVFAEERALREKYGIDGYIGPIREELPLNTTIARLCKMFNEKAMPYLWYTRPGRAPNITFDTGEEELRSILDNKEKEETRKYLFEILQKLGELPPGTTYQNADTGIYIQAFQNLKNRIVQQIGRQSAEYSPVAWELYLPPPF